MMMFKTAVKQQAKLRINIDGPSGAGKTFTALKIATEFVRLMSGGVVPPHSIAFVDTERGSASLYADKFSFDVLELGPPYDPKRYVEAIHAAENAGYLFIIVDSLSHAWNAEGGVLEIVEKAAKRMRTENKFAGWQEGTPAQNALINAITGCKTHIITAMRSKMEYVLEEVSDANGRTRKVPKKVGMAPVQRDQMEYEYTVVLDMDMNHNGIIGKSRCDALKQGIFHEPGADVATILYNWLMDGAPVSEDAVTPPAIQPPQQRPPAPPPADQPPGDRVNAQSPEYAEMLQLFAQVGLADREARWQAVLDAVGRPLQRMDAMLQTELTDRVLPALRARLTPAPAAPPPDTPMVAESPTAESSPQPNGRTRKPVEVTPPPDEAAAAGPSVVDGAVDDWNDIVGAPAGSAAA